MRIVETFVPDIIDSNIDQQKVLLSNRILSLVTPLLDGVVSKRVEERNALIFEFENNQKKISREKSELERLSRIYEKEKKIKNIFDAISNIDFVKFEYNKSLKNEVVVLLRIIEKLPEEKISSYLQNILKISNKTISTSY
jgi:hypothetical protein